MSYTLIVQPVDKSYARQAVDSARVNASEDQPEAEMAEQIEAVKRAVAELLPVVGGTDATVQVEISGNAVAGHNVGEADEVVYLVVRAVK